MGEPVEIHLHDGGVAAVWPLLPDGSCELVVAEKDAGALVGAATFAVDDSARRRLIEALGGVDKADLVEVGIARQVLAQPRLAIYPPPGLLNVRCEDGDVLYVRRERPDG